MIDAYNKALCLARSQIEKCKQDGSSIDMEGDDNNTVASSSEHSDLRNGFKVGDFVRATYEDGIDYEAKIIEIDDHECRIQYLGYNNEELVEIAELLPSWGRQARKKQIDEAALEATQTNHPPISGQRNVRGTQKNFGNCFEELSIPPPPPLPAMLNDGTEDSENLSAMLMSWYMSGYYTGLYQGRKQQRQQQNLRRN